MAKTIALQGTKRKVLKRPKLLYTNNLSKLTASPKQVMGRRPELFGGTLEAAYYDEDETAKSLQPARKRLRPIKFTTAWRCRAKCLRDVREDVSLGDL